MYKRERGELSISGWEEWSGCVGQCAFTYRCVFGCVRKRGLRAKGKGVWGVKWVEVCMFLCIM